MDNLKSSLNENEIISEETTLNNNSTNDNRLKWSQLILFLIYFVGLGIVVGLIVAIFDEILGTNILDIITTGYKGLILDAVLFFFALSTYKKIRVFAFKTLDFSVLLKKSTYLYVFIGFIIFFITQLIIIEVLGIDSAENQNGDIGLGKVDTKLQMLLMFISLAIITPIKEELLYRGIIHRFFESRYNFWVGLIVSSLIFGLLHFDYPVSATIMGAIFVLLYRKTNSLLTSMLLHGLWNLYVTLVIAITYL